MIDVNQQQDPLLNAFEQIDSICKEFRGQWKQGKRPSIEDFLPRVAKNAKSNLFRNLLHTEIEFRRRAKDNPTSEEYIRRFPEFAPLIRQAFYESTMMSLAEFQGTPADRRHEPVEDRTVSFATPAANRLGEYILLRELGRGGFGVVYDAKHQQRLNRVALKTLPLGDLHQGLGEAERLHKFRREFRALSEINHPNLVGMQTLEVDGGQWFFTMDLVDGVDFLAYVRPEGELDEARLRAVLPQLASGIMALHARHIVHRDLKPSNVLIDQNGKVTILDFGLVVELQQRTDQTASLQSARFAGTPVYAAPEQITGQSTAASDWYALGVMLYEALSGERPFIGSVLELFEQKRNASAPQLAGRVHLPAELAQFVDRLLKREPAARPDALEIAKFLSLTAESKRSEKQTLDLPQTLSPSGQLLLGREEQLSQLRALGQRLRQEREPLAVFVSGKSGEGKTTLVEKFLQSMLAPPVRDEAEPRRQRVPTRERGNEERKTASGTSNQTAIPSLGTGSHAPAWEPTAMPIPLVQNEAEPCGQRVPTRERGNEERVTASRSSTIANGVLVLAGRCYDRETVPFKAIDSLIDSLVAYLRGKQRVELNSLLPEDARMLAHLFPVLGRVEAIQEQCKTPLGNIDRKQIRHRAFTALRELLGKISRSQPLVLFIDDLQWGDVDSAEVLFELLHGSDRPAILFVGSYRWDEANESPFLRTWEPLQRGAATNVVQPTISVGPLTESQCLAWVVHRTGSDTDSVREKAREIFQATGGNPYFLDQLIDCFDPETGSFRPAPLHEVLERKLAKLPAEALPLLQMIAVSGKALSISEASQAAGLAQPSYATITHMRSERLVRLIGAESQELVDTYHDKVRETVLDRLDAERMGELHRNLGQTIEARDRVPVSALLATLEQSDPGGAVNCERVFDLAYHFSEGQDPERALLYSLLAAERAKGQFAIEVALEKYGVATTWAAGRSAAIQYRIALGLGETLVWAGKYEEGEPALQEALAQAQTQRERLMVQAHLAASRFRTGAVRDCIAICESALQELSVRIPKSDFGLKLGVYRLRTYEILGRIGLRRSTQSSMPNWKPILAARLLAQVSHAFMVQKNSRANWAASSAVRYAEQIPESSILATALTARAMSFGLLMGRATIASRDFQKAIQIAIAQRDTQSHETAKFWSAMTFMITGSYNDAHQNLLATQCLSEKTGNVYLLNYCRFGLAATAWHRGDLANCVQLSRACFSEGIRIRQIRQSQLVLAYWARATNGKFPFEDLVSCFQPIGEEDCTAYVNLLVAESIWNRQHQRIAESLTTATEAVDVTARHRCSNFVIVHAFPNLVTALRDHSDAIAGNQPQASRELRRKALRIAREAVGWGKRFRCELPFCLRELGLAQAGVGQLRKAWKSVKRSCDVAQQQVARYEFAQSLLALGQLGEQLGRPEAGQQIAEATAALKETEFSREAPNVL